ncbi:Cof-type HAD-IIB family hydrolase [Paenibacillus senegalensis]|uniref:Cof-type HAD-IIB family hydrolase n=1 Tax=Paenibacillus senegalensis TaxID=1465766 RepID=UPI000289D45E|nr:Cof-type HAD-IIB family hydrolase [Paenibacillus senegalensis]
MGAKLCKGIIMDLNGTLLNSDKQVSIRNEEALLRCYAAGFQLIIATARPPRSVKRFVSESILGKCAVVYYNGAYVIDHARGIEAHYPIALDDSTAIIQYCLEQAPNCVLSVEVEDRWYATRVVEDEAMYNLEVRPTLYNTEQMLELIPSKILISEMEITLYDKLKHTFGAAVNVLLTDQGSLVQIMSAQVSKSNAAEQLCKEYGFSLEETIAFGDDRNDLDLFERCGYPVAMGNAIEELKVIASEITGTNDEDGVAMVLERLVPVEIA